MSFAQLYYRGELVGGLDIVKQLNDSGELDRILKQEKPSLNDR